MKKMNNKLKIVIVTLVAALLALTVIGGTLAYFTATDEVTNTFTVGSVDIDQVEEDETGAPYDNTDKVYLPVVNETDPSSDENYIHKVVYVQNTGENAAYIRTFIALPTVVNDLVALDVNTVGTNWEQGAAITGVTVNGVECTVYPFTYTVPVDAGDQTVELLKGTYMIAAVDAKVDPADGVKKLCLPDGAGGYTFYDYDPTDAAEQIDIVIASQAVQANGFSDAATALDTAFPNNPWA